MSNKQAGVTLIELLVTLLVGTVLLMIAVPSYWTFVQNNRATVLTNDFVAALHYSRSESVKRGEPVSLCASANTTQTVCGNAGNWGQGWLIFTDPNGDGVLGSSIDRLKVHGALATGASINTAIAVVTYAGTGFLTAGTGTFSLAATDCTGQHGRSVTISAVGRVSTVKANC